MRRRLADSQSTCWITCATAATPIVSCSCGMSFWKLSLLGVNALWWVQVINMSGMQRPTVLGRIWESNWGERLHWNCMKHTNGIFPTNSLWGKMSQIPVFFVVLMLQHPWNCQETNQNPSMTIIQYIPGPLSRRLFEKILIHAVGQTYSKNCRTISICDRQVYAQKYGVWWPFFCPDTRVRLVSNLTTRNRQEHWKCHVIHDRFQFGHDRHQLQLG